MKTNLNSIVSAIAKTEGKKSQVSIGNCREVLAALKKLYKDPAYTGIIVRYITGAK